MRLFSVLIFSYILLILVSLSAFANDKRTEETIILAGGCFWCLETDFKKLEGVIDAISGYAGGERQNPTYENYNHINGEFPTSHIEVVQVTYDTDKISYDDILHYFLRHIDPTDGGGQFCDRGASYRPAIFASNTSEKTSAKAHLKQAEEFLKQDINVDILPNATFWPAENYHQDYAKKNPVRYKFYRWNCGRDQRVEDLWGDSEDKKSPHMNE